MARGFYDDTPICIRDLDWRVDFVYTSYGRTIRNYQTRETLNEILSVRDALISMGGNTDITLSKWNRKAREYRPINDDGKYI